jgi:YbgC/YbaW family acyl-CoA thioester hydrolase
LESFINHRIAAAEDQLKCFTMDIATQQMTAFVIEQANVKYISPARLGEWIEIASWVCELHRDGFLLEAVVVDKNSRAVRAQAKLNFKSVNSKTGKPVPMLETLLSRSNESLLAKCPTREEYLSTIKPLAETSQRVS